MDVRRFLKPLPESDALTGSLVQVGLVSEFKVSGRWLYAVRPDSLRGIYYLYKTALLSLKAFTYKQWMCHTLMVLTSCVIYDVGTSL